MAGPGPAAPPPVNGTTTPAPSSPAKSTPPPGTTLPNPTSVSLSSISTKSVLSDQSVLSIASTASVASVASVASTSSPSGTASKSSLSEASATSAQPTKSSQSTQSVGNTASAASLTSSTSVYLVSTIFVTDGYTVSSSYPIPTVVAPSSHSSHSSSNTGAIVGGAVGGAVALLLVALLGLFCLRRRRKSTFDGNFDPDRNIQRPIAGAGEVDLMAGRAGGPNVDPEPRPFSLDESEAGYPATGSHSMEYSSSMGTMNPMIAGAAGVGAGALTSREMEQYRQGGRNSMVYDPYNPEHQMYPGGNQQYYPHSDSASMTTSGGAGALAVGGDKSSSAGGGGGGAIRTSKQQEAARAYAMAHGGRPPRGSTVAAGGHPRSGSISEVGHPSNPTSHGSSPPLSNDGTPAALSSSGSGERGAQGGPLGVTNPDVDDDVDIDSGSPVHQHQDAGRFIPHGASETEVPPSYESIPPEDRPHAM